ncbi:MAG: homocysteine methyltransferase [Acidobacteria bacterium]|nr:homocysteine methyltransferase [Acidobacteriota bacterium]
MTKSAKIPDPAPVLDLIEAFRRSKVLFAAVTLGLFDALQPCPQDAASLAAALKLQPDPLERLLDACVALKLLNKTGSKYSNDPVATAYLCRESARALTGYILYSNDVLFRMWSHLEDAIGEGTPRWTQTFGTEASIFDNFFRTAEAKDDFLRGMHGLGLLSSDKIVAAFDLSRFQRMVDLGGATGHLALAACERYPSLHAIIFDLPAVLATTRAYMRNAGEAAKRIELLGGDFFRDDLPQGDLVTLGRVLHDWDEARIRELLTRISQRLPAGGALLIAEKIVDADKSGPLSALLQSLNMLICTQGKERTLDEYRQLLETSGFGNVQAARTGAYLDAILAAKI